MAPPPATGRYPSPRALLERYGLRAKKSWGQNFLGDEAILDDIARLAVPRPGELVVELGSGLGHLTARLLARGGVVVAVERDRDMAAVLRGELGDRIVLLEADAARLDYGRVLREAATWISTATATATASSTSSATSTPTPTSTSTTPSPQPSPPAGAGGEGEIVRGATAGAGGEGEIVRGATAGAGGVGEIVRGAAPAPAAPTRLAVVGNLPYHLTSPILFSLLDQVAHVSRAVFLVQREVAERLAARPGTHAWGILSVLLQREADVSIERIVPPGAFLPPPKVDSAVVCALFRPPADAVADPARFRRLVKAGFAQRRKTLGNALRAARVVEPDALARALEVAAVDPARRGETLTVAEWAALDRALG